MQDSAGRTALHYAVKNGNVEIVELILQIDCQNVPYITNQKGFSPLHGAVASSKITIVEKLLTYCPDAVEQVDQSRRNLLHIAMLSNGIKLAVRLLTLPYIGDKLNQQDKDGNTPLHLIARDIHLQKKTIRDFISQAKQKGANLEIVNQNNFTAEQVLSYRYRLLYSYRYRLRLSSSQTPDKKDDDKRKNIWLEQRNAIMVVMALIATVTFTAAFTVPGGFKGSNEPNPGTALLINNNFFKAFMLFDTTATCTSVVSLLLYLYNLGPMEGGYLHRLLAKIFFGIPLLCMMAALATGVYVVVAPQCLWLAWLIFVACISTTFAAGTIAYNARFVGLFNEVVCSILYSFIKKMQDSVPHTFVHH